MSTNNQEVNELISWYVNGTLPESELGRVEKLLEESEQARRMLAWERKVRDAARNDSKLQCAPELGLSKVMQRIEQQQAEKKETQVEADSVFQKMANWLGSFKLSPAFAMVAAVAVVQFGVIVQIWPTTPGADFAQVRSVDNTPAVLTEDSFLRIAFKEATTEAELRKVLHHAQVEMVAGPTQLGDYFLIVANSHKANAMQTLQASAVVEYVEESHELPARH